MPEGRSTSTTSRPLSSTASTSSTCSTRPMTRATWSARWRSSTCASPSSASSRSNRRRRTCATRCSASSTWSPRASCAIPAIPCTGRSSRTRAQSAASARSFAASARSISGCRSTSSRRWRSPSGARRSPRPRSTTSERSSSSDVGAQSQGWLPLGIERQDLPGQRREGEGRAAGSRRSRRASEAQMRLWPRRREERAGLANPSAATLDSFGLTASYSGERVTIKRALEIAAVRAAIEMISKAVGVMCPLKVYRIMDDDERVEARTHRSWRMLHDQPNPATTAAAFWSAVSAHCLIWDQCFIGKERDPGLGEVISLWLLDPTQMEIDFDGREKRFRYTQDGKTVLLGPDDVLHIVGFGLTGLWGDSRIEQAKQAIGVAIARAKFEGGFYKRGARNPAVIEYPGRLGEKAEANMRKTFDLWHAGVENMHRVPILEEGAKFNSVGQNLDEMQFAELAQQTRTDIAVLFGVPPAYLGGTTGDSLTYATTESTQITFAQMAVAPFTTLIGKALSADPAILPWNVMFAEFVLEGLMRADMRTRSEYWKTMKDVLGLKPEYIASRENIPHDALEEPKPVPAQLQPFQGQDVTDSAGDVVQLPQQQPSA